MNLRSVGVEEELLLVEPATGQPQAVAGTVMREADNVSSGDHSASDVLEFELQQQQLETNTRPCRTLSELSRELQRCRAAAATAADKAGVQVAALATSPVPVSPELVTKDRYRQMAGAFGLTASDQLTCGCHVHVSVSSPDEAVGVLDRIRPWLAVLLALSANSPFWQGQDSSYASYRYQAWGRWPGAGTTGPFGTARAYRDTLDQMLATGTLLDTGMVYFDARLSEHYPTIEIRIADVCLRRDDAVLIAALTRALVETEARAWQAGQPAPEPRTEVLRLAAWRASRSGISADLVDPGTWRPARARNVVRNLAEHVRDALTDADDADVVADLIAASFALGNGATVQRDVYRQSGQLSDVVSTAVELTRGD
jgi:glutamate---cysteine ligase / carboxylate-amine ligase